MVGAESDADVGSDVGSDVESDGDSTADEDGGTHGLMDPGLEARLLSPAGCEAFLAWLVQGARAYYRRGLAHPTWPARAQRAVAEYRGACDRFAQWWGECVREADGSVVRVDEALASCRRFLRLTAAELPKNRFVNELRRLRHVATRRRTGGRRVTGFWGVQLID